MTLIKKLFTPPIFADEEKTHQAYLLHTILLALIVLPIPYVLYVLIQAPEESNRALTFIAASEVINIIPFVMLRHGQVRSASVFQIVMLWLFFTLIAVTGPGIYGIAYLLGNGLVITISGILLGGRGALAMTLLAMIEGGIMVYAELHGWIPPDVIDDALPTWIVSVVLFAVGAILQQLASRTLRIALVRARESEEKYRLISQVSSDYVFATAVHKDGSADLSWVAGAFQQMTGYTFEEYVASGGWLGHVHHDDLEKDAHDMETLHNNKDIRSEIRTFAKNGEVRWERIFAHPIWDEKENRLTGIIGAVQDVTEQKRTESALAHERDLLQIFMDNIPDSIYFKDIESRFIRVNKTQARFLGVDNPQDAIGKNDLDFQNPELAQKFILEEKQIMETGQSVLNRVEFNPTQDGNPRWLSATKVPVKDGLGQAIGVIGISRDITEQKNTEEYEQRRRMMLEKVVTLGKYVTESDDLSSTIKKIWHGVHDDLGFDRLAVFLFNPARNTMDDTVGTNNAGEMVDHWNLSYPIGSAFEIVLQDPDGIYFTHNYDEENNIPEGHEMYGIKDYVAVAAWAGNKPVAVICADHGITRRPIAPEQLEALRLFGGYAGLAIENARLNEKIKNELALQIQAKEREEHRREILEKVIRLGQSVTEVYDLRTTLLRIWHGVHDDLEFDRVGIYLYNHERNSMDGTFGTNNQGEMIDEWHTWFSMDQDNQDSNSFLHVFEKPDTIFLSNNFEDDYNIAEGHNMSGVKDHASIGAWAGEKPVAVISVDHRITGRPFTEEQLEGMRLFAGYAGLAIENSRLKDAIENELMEQKRAEETEQRRRVMMEKVIKLGKQVTAVNDFQTTLKNIWNGVRYDLDFDRVGLFLYNSQENIMEGAYGTDHDGKIYDAWHVKFGLDKDALFYKVLGRPDGLFFTKDYENELNLPADHEMAGVKYYAVVAVWTGTKPVAIISVDQLITGRAFSDEQLEALRLFAGYAGLAISNANLNTALEKELTQRQNFIYELETKNAELERFTYTVSHDLKSPLVTIRGFLGYLERDAQESNFEKFRHDTHRIETAVEKMQNLLQDLLELSRIGRLMNTPVEIPFNEIVKDALEIVDGQIKARNVLIDYKSSDVVIKCDRIRVTEVLQNLIDNAIKFMGTQPNPRIEIGSFFNDNKENVFYVKDNGIGIAPEFHEKIFGLFDKLSTDSDGTGIGLALVKRIVEVHGGRIWVESQVGKGAALYFTLP